MKRQLSESVQDWTDLNAQARHWCEYTANVSFKRKLGMTPKVTYVMEKPHLLSLPSYIPVVTQIRC